jgi:hypothetical protein
LRIFFRGSCQRIPQKLSANYGVLCVTIIRQNSLADNIYVVR